MRSLLCFGPLSLAGLIVFASSACSDDATTPNTAPIAEVEAGADAAPPVVLPSPEAGAAEGPVTVLVTNSAGGIAGVKVAFLDASGGSKVVTTAADGKATHVMQAGGTVLAAETVNGTKRVTAIVGVEPNDVIPIPSANVPAPPSEPYGTLHITSITGVENATRYSVSDGCEEADFLPEGEAQDLPISSACLGPGGKSWLLVTAQDNTGKRTYATKEVTFSQKGQTQPFAIAAGDWVPESKGTLRTTGTVPALAYNTGGTLAYVAGPRKFLTLSYGNLVKEGPPADSPFTRIPGGTSFPGLFRNSTGCLFGDPEAVALQGGQLSSTVSVKYDALPSEAPVTRNLQELLPRVHTVTVRGVDAPEVTWSSDGATTAIAGAVDVSSPAAVGTPSLPLTWRVIFPGTMPSGTKLTLPAIPAELAEYTAQESFVLVRFGLFDVPELGSYKGFRTSAVSAAVLKGLDGHTSPYRATYVVRFAKP